MLLLWLRPSAIRSPADRRSPRQAVSTAVRQPGSRRAKGGRSSPLRARMPLAFSFIIRVEDRHSARREVHSGQIIAQQEGLEEQVVWARCTWPGTRPASAGGWRRVGQSAAMSRLRRRTICSAPPGCARFRWPVSPSLASAARPSTKGDACHPSRVARAARECPRHAHGQPNARARKDDPRAIEIVSASD